MRQVIYLLVCLQLALFSQLGFAESKLKADNTAQKERQAVQQTYYDWTKAIAAANGNPSVIAALYAPNAILLATMSPDIKLNLNENISEELITFTNNDLREYFAKLTSLKNVHVVTEKMYTQLFDDVAINTGIYTFVYTDDKGKTVELPARFTFVYEEIDDKWYIINHHSSYLPEDH